MARCYTWRGPPCGNCDCCYPKVGTHEERRRLNDEQREHWLRWANRRDEVTRSIVPGCVLTSKWKTIHVRTVRHSTWRTPERGDEAWCDINMWSNDCCNGILIGEAMANWELVNGKSDEPPWIITYPDSSPVETKRAATLVLTPMSLE